MRILARLAMPIKPLRNYLASDPALARIAQGAAEARALDALLRRTLPQELAKSASAAELRQQTLVIVAENGPTAAKIQQMSRSIVAALNRAGVAVKAILVRVGPGFAAPRQANGHELTPGARAALADSAASLPKGPLREALERLATRARAGGANRATIAQP